MESERFQQALRRLEAAVERVERLPVPTAAAPDERLADLERRHARLRDGAAQALNRLDRLIEGQS
jgi:hypothetical protein